MNPVLRAIAFILAVSAMPSASAQPAAVRVTIDGAVLHPATLELTGAPRLADAIRAATPRRDAYVLGASWMRPIARPEQVRLRAGLLHDLELIRGVDDTTAAKTAMTLATVVDALPITGRVRHTLLPELIAVRAELNQKLSDGDHIIYPSRPAHVVVLGSVDAPCRVPFNAAMDAADYLAACPANSAADPDVLYAIQPDGAVQEVGIALWNHSEQPIAAGATLYVPLRRRMLAKLAPDFNTEFARFLATQPLPAQEPSP